MRTATLTTIVAASLGLAALLAFRAPRRDSAARRRRIAPSPWACCSHTPAPADTVDEGLRVAEQLRRRYGIDSGDVHADRVAAALRARDEVLARARRHARPAPGDRRSPRLQPRSRALPHHVRQRRTARAPRAREARAAALRGGRPAAGLSSPRSGTLARSAAWIEAASGVIASTRRAIASSRSAHARSGCLRGPSGVSLAHRR